MKHKPLKPEEALELSKGEKFDKALRRAILRVNPKDLKR